MPKTGIVLIVYLAIQLKQRVIQTLHATSYILNSEEREKKDTKIIIQGEKAKEREKL